MNLKHSFGGARLCRALFIGSIIAAAASRDCGTALHAAVVTNFVATTGNNGNPGTEASPWLTIAYGTANMTAGGRLQIRGGTYAEHISTGYKHGTVGQNTIIENYPGETVFVKPTSTTAAFLVGGASFVTISGLFIDCTNASPDIQAGIKIDNGSHNITVTNTEIYNVGNSHGFLLAAPSYSNLLTHITAHDINKLWSGSANHGVYLSGSVSNTIVEYYWLYNMMPIAGQGTAQPNAIHQFDGDGYLGNTFRFGTISNCFVGVGLYSSSAGAQVYNNFIKDCVYGEKVWSGCSSNRTWNNTFYHCSGYAISVEGGSGADNQWANNLISDGTANGGIYVGTTEPITYWTNNLSCDNVGFNFQDDSGKAVKVGNLFNNSYNAAYVSAPSDLRIATNSSAWQAGITIAVVGTDFYGTVRPQNGANEIGAHELVTGAVTPTVAWGANDAFAFEPAIPGSFQITRSLDGTNATLTVNYRVTGTATNGVNYSTIATNVAFAAGDITKPVTITPIDDAIANGLRTVILDLWPSANYTLTGNTNASMGIVDNDGLNTGKKGNQ